jgi:hypothetical protein
MHLASAHRTPPFDFAQGKPGPAQPSFLRSGDAFRVLVCAVTVQGRTDAQEKLEGVAEIRPVIAIESVGAAVDRELRAETDVDTIVRDDKK